VTFFKKKNGAELFTDEEVAEWGEPDFSLRVSIQLEKDVGWATLVTHALPLKVVDLMGYPGWVDEGRAYPSLLLHGAEMRLGPLSTRNVGLAMTPYVWTEEEEMVTFCVREVRRAIRKFMEEAEYARTALTPQDLSELVMGPESPDISSQRQPWTWPELEEQEEGVDAEEEGIENNGNMMFSSLIKIIGCTMISPGFWKHVASSLMAALCCNTRGTQVAPGLTNN
jgi:hypothetical protein